MEKKRHKSDIYHEELDWAMGSCSFVLYGKTKEESKLKKAIFYFKELIEKHPDNIQYKFDYANVILCQDFNKGMEMLLEVVKDKRYDYFWKSIGNMYHGKGQYPEAINAYMEYKKLYPNDTNIQNLIDESEFQSDNIPF
jgi:tetratricopeptide (TPR) repeat protein